MTKFHQALVGLKIKKVVKGEGSFSPNYYAILSNGLKICVNKHMFEKADRSTKVSAKKELAEKKKEPNTLGQAIRSCIHTGYNLKIYVDRRKEGFRLKFPSYIPSKKELAKIKKLPHVVDAYYYEYETHGYREQSLVVFVAKSLKTAV